MTHRTVVGALSVIALSMGARPAAAAAPLDADACVRIALERSARVRTALADVEVYRAQADQVEALLSIKVQAITYLAPMYRAEGGIGFGTPYHHDLTDGDRTGTSRGASSNRWRPSAATRPESPRRGSGSRSRRSTRARSPTRSGRRCAASTRSGSTRCR